MGKEYDIWIEGYAATGESSTASYVGKSQGETFEDAVKSFRYPEDVKRQWAMKGEDPVLIHKGSPLNLDTDKSQSDGFRRHGGKLCSWACRYFDNEIDARKSFG